MPSPNRGKAAGLLPALIGGAFAAALASTAAVAAHAQTVPPANPETPAAAGTPAAAAPPQAPPPSITFNALLDGYYAYNFTKPKILAGTSSAGQVGPGSRNFDSANNAFALGLAEIGVAKAVNDSSRLGFTVKLAYGPTADAVASGLDANNKNILQAYGTFLIPAGGKDLTVDAGKFVTHLGYEVIEPELNWNYSRSDSFQYFLPYYHTGVRASYPFSPKLTATGYIENGWNSASADNNVSKAYGFEFVFTPSTKYSVILNGLTSSEPDPYTPAGDVFNRSKNVIEPILTYSVSNKLSAVADLTFDFGKGSTPDKPLDTNGTWSSQGYALYLRYAMASGSAFTLRGEYFADDKGYLTSIDGQKGGEITFTYGIKSPAFPGAETRFEYRYDSLSKEGLLQDSEGSFGGPGSKHQKNQHTLSISELLTF